MAEEQDDLELADDQAGGSKKKLIIIIAVAAVLLIGGGVAAWLLLGGDDEEQADAEQAEAAPAQEQAAPTAAKGEVSYQDLGPVFVANMTGKPRMLQVGLQVRMYYPELGEFLKHNDPALRHAILNLMGAQNGETLKTREGKDALRGQIKEEINKLITKYRGPGEVDEVLFSSFVMQ